MNINLALDKEYHTANFTEMLDLPPHALKGLAPKADGVP
eukprot:UN19872